jgi:uncharacterized membrane protein
MSNGDGKSALGLDANLVALLCYIGNFVCSLGLILSIITVVTDKTNKLARFHAFQSILLSVLGLVLGVVYAIVGAIGGAIDAQIGFPVLSLGLLAIVAIIGIGLFIGMILAAVKGFQGQIYKLPIVGNMADNYSN